jgi:hypothetical protein
MTLSDPDVLKEYKAPKHTVLVRKTLGGTVASSPFRHCRPANATIKQKKMTKRRMILQLLHGYRDPPHCRANIKHTIDGTKIAILARSSCFNFAEKDTLTSSVESLLRRKIIVTRIVMPARGRHNQKHHRQPSVSAISPPRRGPTAMALLSSAPIIPR